MTLAAFMLMAVPSTATLWTVGTVVLELTA